MLPITQVPVLIEESCEHFQSVFSWNQRKLFQKYLTGLISNPNVTVSFIANSFSDGGSQKALNRFLTEYDWDLQELNKQRLVMLQEDSVTRWTASGVVCLDDTLIDKSGKFIPGAGHFYDHSHDCYKHAQNIVTSNYADEGVSYPLDFRQYYKEDSKEAEHYGFKTKILLACELVTEAVKNGVAADTFVADSGFMCRELADHIKSLKKKWVMAAKSDLLVKVGGEFMQLKDYAKKVPKELFLPCEAGGKTYYVHTRTMFLNCLNCRVKVAISYDNPLLEGEPKFLLSNNLRWERNRIIRTYTLRHFIEAFYRDAKQHLGLGGCQLRKIKGVHRHWILVFTAYSILKQYVAKSGLTKKLKETLRTIGDGCRYVNNQILDALVKLVHDLTMQKQKPEQIIQTLKNTKNHIKTVKA